MDAPKRTTPFGKYELIEKVASGGMAEVFRACTRGEAGFEKYLAIKRILPHLSRDSEFVVMLIDEAKIAVTLNHANVVQIYDLGKADGTYYIAMEFVEGADLKAVLLRAMSQGGPIPPALAVFLIMEILKGLEYAHQKKVMSNDSAMDLHIIHRDISPPNILVSYEGEVKIVDFGIAKANTRMMETSAGVLKGKFEYMSPEQAAGLQLDHRTDIFSAALCLYEAMTGVNPFTADSDLQVIQNVRAGRFPPASQLNPQIPHRLDQILNRALAKEKEDRYQSATELRNDLAHAAYETGLIATSPKLAAYMKTIFAEDLAAGRPFVSGASIGAEADRKNLAARAGRKGRSRSPYHVASELKGGWSDPANYDPRTVIRATPMADEAPPPPGEPPPRREPPRGDGRNARKSQPPRRDPREARLEDLSADATFLAPPSARPPRRPGPAKPNAGLKQPPRPAADPLRQPPRGHRDLESQPTFLSGHGRPEADEDDGTEGFQTLRDMEPPFEDARTDPRGRRRAQSAGNGPKAAPPRPQQRGGPSTEDRATVSNPVPQREPDPSAHPTAQGQVPQGRRPSQEKATDPTLAPSAPLAAETRDVPAPSRPLPPGQHFEPMGGEFGEAHLEELDWNDDAPDAATVAAPPPPAGIQASWRTHVAALTIGLAIGVLGTGVFVNFTEGETKSAQPVASVGDTAEIVVRAPDGSISMVNGQEVGRAYPLTLALPISKAHQLEVQVEGHRPYRHTLKLSPGETRVFDLTVVQPSPSAPSP